MAAGDGLRPPLSARTAALWSVGAHLLLIASAILFTRLSLPAPRPPAYNVELVAAPAGPRALGSVQEGPTAPPTPAAAPTAPPREATIPEIGRAHV